MIKNENGFFCLTPAEFAAQCELAGTIPRLCTVAEANNSTATGLRAWPSGLLPWCETTDNVHVLAWPDGRCMVSPALFQAMGGAV
jgi:hypothetical protein